jgi:hypothetical protein
LNVERDELRREIISLAVGECLTIPYDRERWETTDDYRKECVQLKLFSYRVAIEQRRSCIPFFLWCGFIHRRDKQVDDFTIERMAEPLRKTGQYLSFMERLKKKETAR